MPRRATWCAATPDRLLPSKDQDPSLGLSKPVRRLKKVVLPAPFGPMSAVMTPALHLEVVDLDRRQAAEAPATPSATRMGSGFGTPGRGLDPGERRCGGPRVPADPRRRWWERRARQRASRASSFLSPKIPCGRKIMRAMSRTPTRMKRTMPTWLVS
jgi:hypothetical protein